MASRERSSEPGAARVSAGLTRRVFVQRMVGLGAATLLVTCAEQPVTSSSTRKLRRIGYLSGNATASAMNYAGPFRDQLRLLGYVEGRDIEPIEFRIAEGVAERLPVMAAELVALPVDVLIAEAQSAHIAARNATKSIPIVITLSADPIAAGLVDNLARPGGNITGVTTASLQLTGKRVELLKETVPGLSRIGIIWNANISNLRAVVKATQEGARTLGVETEVFDVHDPVELDAAVETMARQKVDGLVMLTGLSIIRDRAQVPDIAAKYRLPQMFSDIEIVRAGGLMHFGANYATIYREAAILVDKILRGANPGELPIAQPTQVDFIVNLEAARRIGLKVPDSVVRMATEVIR
jgi:putative ABC transport system substrate-binding protein